MARNEATSNDDDSDRPAHSRPAQEAHEEASPSNSQLVRSNIGSGSGEGCSRTRSGSTGIGSGREGGIGVPLKIKRLLGDRLLVEPIKPATTLRGIHLPDQALDDSNVGGPKQYRVIEVGPGKRLKNGTIRPMPVSVGDRIICHSYTTGPYDLGQGRMILTESEIICVLPLDNPVKV